MYARLLLEYFGSTVALFSCCAVALIGCLERNGWSSSVLDQGFSVSFVVVDHTAL